MMMITLRNEVLSSSWNRLLILPWYALLNATGISTLPYSKEGFHHCRPGPWRYAGVPVGPFPLLLIVVILQPDGYNEAGLISWTSLAFRWIIG